MRAEVINLADRKVELESERPSLATEVLRSVRLHLRREHKEEQCLHVVDNRWIVSFSYYPRQKSVPAEASVGLYYENFDCEQDLRFKIGRINQTKKGRYAPAAAGAPVVHFLEDRTEIEVAIISGDDKDIQLAPPQVSRMDLIHLAQLAKNPWDLSTIGSIEMPKSWPRPRMVPISSIVDSPEQSVD